MEQKDIISAIENKNAANGFILRSPASKEQIVFFEQLIGCELPDDFLEFYSYCNGFSTEEDMFNITPVEDIISQEQDFGNGWFCFAEYMIFSDTWAVQIIGKNSYEMYSSKLPRKVLTTSLAVFLSSFQTGNVFGKGGLYDLEAGVSAE
jgi:hypothetical protein